MNEKQKFAKDKLEHIMHWHKVIAAIERKAMTGKPIIFGSDEDAETENEIKVKFKRGTCETLELKELLDAANYVIENQ